MLRLSPKTSCLARVVYSANNQDALIECWFVRTLSFGTGLVKVSSYPLWKATHCRIDHVCNLMVSHSHSHSIAFRLLHRAKKKFTHHLALRIFRPLYYITTISFLVDSGFQYGPDKSLDFVTLRSDLCVGDDSCCLHLGQRVLVLVPVLRFEAERKIWWSKRWGNGHNWSPGAAFRRALIFSFFIHLTTTQNTTTRLVI